MIKDLCKNLQMNKSTQRKQSTVAQHKVTMEIKGGTLVTILYKLDFKIFDIIVVYR